MIELTWFRFHIKVLELTVFCAIGLLIQSVYLIVLVASGEQNNIATIVILIVSEVILSFVLLALLHPGRVQGYYSGRKERKSVTSEVTFTYPSTPRGSYHISMTPSSTPTSNSNSISISTGSDSSK